MLVSLTQDIHNQTDQLFFGKRLYQATKSFYKKKGALKTGAVLLTGTAAALYTLATSYFNMEGVVRSYMEVHHRNGTLEGLRGLGDVGGWTGLPIFSAFALSSLVVGFVYEGEYYKIASIAKKWLQKNKGDEEDIQQAPKEFYVDMHALLDTYRQRCLFSQELIVLTIIEILKKNSILCQEKKYLQDVALAKFLCKIQTKLDEKKSLTHHFYRIYIGLKADRQGIEKVKSLVFGALLPAVLMYTAICSFVGEAGLAKVLFVNREDLADTGHFGEWPINAVEAIGLAIYLYKTYLLHEGDFVIARSIFEKASSKLKHDAKIHNRLCDLAHAKLSEVAASCGFMKLLGDYKIQKL